MAKRHITPRFRKPDASVQKQEFVEEALRAAIVGGGFPPKCRLPIRSELKKQFRVSNATLQAALSQLISDGFLRPQGRLGTFVCDHPPHLSAYGLAFPHPPASSEVRSRFWQAMQSEAHGMAAEGPKRFPIYFGLDGHVDNEVYQRLSADVASHRLAGVIYVYVETADLLDSPLAGPGVSPGVAINTRTEGWKIPVISPDMRVFIDRALDHLSSKGRRKIAFLTVSNTPQEHLAHFESAAARRGMTTRPAWTQCVGWPEVKWASNCVEAVMLGTREDRPDGMIIFDDNIQEHAAAGMMRAGVRVPEGLEVVAHSNFPVHGTGVLPLTRLGFDARQILKIAIEYIDRQRRGEKVPAHTLVPPRFEHEAIGKSRS